MTPEQAAALADAIRGGPDREFTPGGPHLPCVLIYPGETELTIDDRFEADDLVRAVLAFVAEYPDAVPPMEERKG